jgi:hypothetical protein
MAHHYKVYYILDGLVPLSTIYAADSPLEAAVACQLAAAAQSHDVQVDMVEQVTESSESEARHVSHSTKLDT